MRINKVNSLPGSLNKDDLYAVSAAGDEFKLYLADNTSIAVPLRNPIWINHSGRYTLNTDNRWVGDASPANGPTSGTFVESGGTGADPVIDWDCLGWLLPESARLTRMIMAGTAGHAEITDLDISLNMIEPATDATQWASGIDANGEIAVTELYRGLWWANVDAGQPTFTGDRTDMHLRDFQLDADIPALSMLALFVKPSGTLTATRNFNCTITYVFE